MLHTSGLTVELGAHRVLRDVQLTLRSGELVALAGEPGAGKTAIVRCVAGDLAPTSGEILVAGRPLPPDPAAARRRGVAIVWQDLALCDNLDVAGNVLLGSETRRLMSSDLRFQIAAADVLTDLRIPIRDTTRLVGELPDGQRRLIAVARALTSRLRLLVLDEPTAALGAAETSDVEHLIMRLREQGTTVLMVSGDPEQMFRIADRIVVLRHGKVVGELDPHSSHPDDVAALQSGHRVDSSARRQLTRLHSLADRLVSADPASSLSLIVSALGSALRVPRLCIHVADGGRWSARRRSDSPRQRSRPGHGCRSATPVGLPDARPRAANWSSATTPAITTGRACARGPARRSCPRGRPLSSDRAASAP